MVLFFKAEVTVGNMLTGNNTEQQLRAPWDNFLLCVLGHFFGREMPRMVPARRVLVDVVEGKFTFV